MSINVLIIDWSDMLMHQPGLKLFQVIPIPIWYKRFALNPRNRSSMTPNFRIR